MLGASAVLGAAGARVPTRRAAEGGRTAAAVRGAGASAAEQMAPAGGGGGQPFGVRSTFLRAYVAGQRRRRGRPRARCGGRLLALDRSSEPQLWPVSVGEGGWHRRSCSAHRVATTD